MVEKGIGIKSGHRMRLQLRIKRTHGTGRGIPGVNPTLQHDDEDPTVIGRIHDRHVVLNVVRGHQSRREFIT
jgi:hypothetical protein